MTPATTPPIPSAPTAPSTTPAAFGAAFTAEMAVR